MANNYTQFSFDFSIKADPDRVYDVLEATRKRLIEESGRMDSDASLQFEVELDQLEGDPDTLQIGIYEDESGDIEHVAEFLKDLQKAFDVEEAIYFE